ncbi:MAG: dTMP kinase [Dehalococcoidales bacterium]|jgi:dTMP kinase
MSLFITLEGGEGCGKSSQAKALYGRLKRRGIPALLIHEPGSTALGQRINRLLKWAHDTSISPLSELLLFNAARSQLVSQVIKPALKEGKVVLCDRFSDSTTAYQSYGRGLDFNTVRQINELTSQNLKPDITILLDMPPETGLARKGEKSHDRFESEAIDFHRRVRQGYLELAQREQERWLVIDARKPKGEIAAVIWQRVNELISQQKETG